MKLPVRSLLMVAALALWLGACATAKPGSPHLSPQQKYALKQYHLGIDAYSNSHYARAIKHWKEAEAKDPTLPRVQEYIDRAQNMIKGLKTMDDD